MPATTGHAPWPMSTTPVYQALDRASDALAAATCNARDFYPQGDAAWQQARNERAEIFRKLAEVQAYAEAWMARASDHL